jgi:hypothetical protein
MEYQVLQLVTIQQILITSERFGILRVRTRHCLRFKFSWAKHTLTCTNIHACTCTNIHTHVHTTQTYIHTHTQNICTHAHTTHKHAQIHTYATHAQTHTCTHAHTHTHHTPISKNMVAKEAECNFPLF